MQIDNEDNGWYERGELPPVGTECETLRLDGKWDKVKVLLWAQYSGVGAVCQGSGFWAANSVASRFRPIKSERERVIDEATKRLDVLAGCINIPNRNLVEIFYDAGFLKLPDGDKS